MSLRERPWVSIRIVFEDEPKLRVFAESLEDEARLWEWLRSSGALPRAAEVALATLDELRDDREASS